MLQAEWTKIKYLPLPRWTALAVLAAAVITGAALIVFRPKDADVYLAVPSITVDTVLTIAGAVFGVWVAALEFSAGTMQRTLTAEPDRSRVLTSKLVTVLVASIVIGAAAAATAGGLTHLGIIRAGAPESAGHLARAVFSVVPDGIFAALIGFGAGLLARSMGGGITFALGFLYVLSGVLSFIPKVKGYSYNQGSSDLSSSLAGSGGGTVHNGGVGLLIVVVWIVIVVVPGWFFFLRADLK